MSSTKNTVTAIRRLVVLQGANALLQEIVIKIKKVVPGDWVCVSNDSNHAIAVVPTNAKSLLGREFTHGIFDATTSFNLDAFLILAGTLKRGSVLIVTLPNNLFSRADLDSLRWNDAAMPIATPNFMRHLQDTFHKHGIIIHRINKNTLLTDIINDVSNYAIPAINKTKKLHLTPTKEQQEQLIKLKNSSDKVIFLTAKRGRGKSALAGFFTYYADSLICAPSKQSVATLYAFCKPKTPFYAPDTLVEKLKNGLIPPKWIILDEAAMIPLPILKIIISYANQILLLTTTEGYEGTGQGFLLKLFPDVEKKCQLTMQMPIRWLNDDPIEAIIADLLFESSVVSVLPDDITLDSSRVYLLPANVLVQDKQRFKQIYGLLKCAHYRTTPTDLRRLFDASTIDIVVTEVNSVIIGAVVMLKEGGLSQHLSNDVWLGIRRPRGNLVAQYLTIQGGEIAACQFLSLRVNRIVVHRQFRRQGVGKKMLAKITHVAALQKYDFISVSFTYQKHIYAFWQASGFTLVQVASRQDAVGGTYSVIMVQALTARAEKLEKRLVSKLERNWFWLRDKMNIMLPITANTDTSLHVDDLQELSGFAHASRSYEATYGALCRLKNAHYHYAISHDSKLLSMVGYETEAIKKYQLTGKKAFIAALRGEIKHILSQWRIKK